MSYRLLFLVALLHLASLAARAAPPNAPSSLTAQGTASKVVLTWTAPADDGGGAIDGYNVYRCAGTETSCDSSTDWLGWADGASTTTYTDSTVMSGSTYRYAVGSSRSSELSAFSNQPTVKVADPGAPSGLSGQGTASKVVLTWTVPADDGGGAIDGYNVYRCAGSETSCDSSTDWLGWADGASTTTYTDSTVTSGSTYRYAVGSSRASALSAWSNQPTVKVADPGAPSGLSGQGTASKVVLTWTVPADDGGGAIDGYNVYRCAGSETSCDSSTDWLGWAHGASTTTYTDDGSAQALTSGSTYRYAVASSRASALSAWSNQVTVKAVDPRAPSGLSAKATASRVYLSWLNPSVGGSGELDGYNVYRCAGTETSCDFSTDWLAWVDGATTPWYDDTSVTADTLYRYAVGSSRAGALSAWSNQVTVRTVDPGAPSGLTVTSTSATSVGLSWMAPADDGGGAVSGYYVFRSRCEPDGGACTNASIIGWITDGTTFTDTADDTTVHEGHGHPSPVARGATYRYDVVSLRLQAFSARSNQVTATAQTPRAPGAPSLTAWGSASTVALTWSAPSDTGSSSLTGYTLYRGAGGACDNVAPLQTGIAADATSAEDASVTDGSTYCYQLTASNGIGEGPRSAGVVVTATEPPAPEAPVALVVESAATESIGLSWTAPADDGHGALDGYNIFRCAQSEGEACLPEWIAWVARPDGEHYSDGDVTEGTRYRYAVASTRNDLVSGWSNQVTVVARATTRPGVPTQPMGQAVGSGVTLSWTGPTDGGGAVDGYNVYRCEQGEGEACLPEWIAWASGTSYTDAGVTPGTEYRYAVAASRNGLTGELSTTLSVTAIAAPVRVVPPTAPRLTPPAAPAPLALVVESASTESIVLGWTAPADDGHGALDGYNVYRCAQGGEEACTPEWIAWVARPDGESYTDGEVTEGTRYRYAVASTRNDLVSEWSNQVTVVARVSPRPGAPTQLTARASGAGVTLSWAAPPDDGAGVLDGYNVYRCEQGEGEVCSPEWIAWASGTSYTDAGVTPGTEYRYAVAASRNGLTGELSTPITVTAIAAPAPARPVDLMVESAGTESIVLGWTAPADDGYGALDGYNIYRCAQGGEEACTPEWIAWVARPDGESYTDGEVTEDTRYRYAVASTRNDLVSEWSNQVTVVARVSPRPGAPTQLTARASGAGVTLSWAAPPDDGAGVLDGYNVYRCAQGEGEACTPVWIAWVLLSDGERFTDTEATAGTLYRYAVVSSRNGLIGEQSSQVTVTAETIPAPGTPGNLGVIRTSFYSIELGWTAPEDDGHGALDGYNIYRCEQGEGKLCTPTWIDWVQDGTMYTDSGVTSETGYRYAVAASRLGLVSAWSNPVTATAVALPARPVDLMVESAATESIVLGWTAPADDGHGALDGYNVYRCAQGGEEACTPEWIAWVARPDGESYTDGEVTEDTRYRYAVASTRNDLVSEWSNQVTVVARVSPRPGAPTQLTARASGAGVTLSWAAPPDDGAGVLDGYNVYRCAQGEGEACTPVWIAWVLLSDGERFTDTEATAGTLYRYAVVSSRNGLIGDHSATAVAPPAPPLALMVESAGTESIVLSWTAPADDGHGALDGYNVYRCAQGGEEACTPEWIAWVARPDGESYTDGEVTEDTRYRYAVAASRNDLVSAWSNQVTVVARVSPRPGAPTQLTARASGAGVTLSWAAPPDDGAGALDGYNVYRCQEGETACTPVWVAWVSGTSFTDSDVVPDSGYRYAVAASRNGLIGDHSASVPVTAVAAPAPAPPLALMVESAGTESIVLSWTAPADDGHGALDGYNVYRCAQGGEEACTPEWIAWVARPDGESYTDGEVTEDTRYRYAVAASRNDLVSAWSNQVTVVARVSPRPGAPTQLTARASGAGVTLSWAAPPDDGAGALDGYNVYRCQEGETACTPVWVAWVSGTSFTDSDVVPDSGYRYAVAASRNGLIGDHSATAVAPPAPPLALMVESAGTESIVLSWTAPADDGHGALDGYNVYRCAQGGEEACTPEWIAWVARPDGESYTDGEVTEDTRYRYAVAASRNDLVSAWSNQVTVVARVSPRPGAPTQLTARASGAGVTLSWAAPPDDGAGALDGYNVYRCQEGETACTPVWVAWVSGTSFTDSDVVPDSGYRYAVAASRNGLIGDHSASVPVTAVAAPAPAPPLALMVESAGTESIVLSWTAPADDGHGALDGYNVYRCAQGGEEACTPEWIAWVARPDGESYTDGEVTEDTRYRYAVAASRNDLVSAWSNQVTVVARVSPRPGAPTQLTARASGAGVTLSWAAPPDDGAGALDGYNVYRCQEGETACTPVWVAWVSGTSFTDSDVVPDSGYRYAVAASRNGLIGDHSATAVAPPAPPLALMVESAGTESIVLSWTAPADDGHGALDGYNVYRCAQGGEEACTPEWIAWVARPDGESYTDGEVTEDTRYRYAVAASRNDLVSAWSNQVTVVARVSPRPGAPTQLTARASGAGVTLSWAAPPDDGAGALDGYNVYRCQEGETACTPVWVAWVSGTSFTDSDVVPDSGYRYAVAASRNGLIGDHSASVPVTAVAAPAPAPPLALMVESAGTESIVLSWTAPADDGHGALDGYNVYRCAQGGEEACTPEWIAWVARPDGESYTDGEVTEDTRYRYAVAASRNDLVSAWSNQVTVVARVSPRPGAPTQLTARASGAGVTLSWAAPPDDGAGALDGYNVYRCQEGETACTPVWVAWVSGTSFTDSDVVPDSGYRYAVAASRNGLIGDHSATAVAPPAPPLALMVESAGTESIVLSWTAPADDGHGALDGYNVYRCAQGGEEACTPEWIYWVPGGTRYTDFGVTAETEYRYAVAASRNSLVGAWSREVAAVASADWISSVERQAMEKVSVSMARSMLSSIVPTISRRFTAETGASEMTLAGRNITPDQFVERNSGVSEPRGGPVLSRHPGNIAPFNGGPFPNHSGSANPTARTVGSPRFGETIGGTAGDRSGVVGGERLLTNSRFAVGLGAMGEGGRSWTVWGSADIQQFSGNSSSDAQFEGHVLTGHLGADVPFGGDHLFGVAVTHSVGEADFVTTNRAGRMGLELFTVVPYAKFLFGKRTDAWFILGTGSGERSSVIGDGSLQRVDVVPQLAAFGGRHALGSAVGGIDWNVQGDASAVRFESEDDFSVSVQRVRFGIEGSSTFSLDGAATVTPFVELNVRVDGSTDGASDGGLELVSGALFKHPGSGFWLETRGRIFVLRSEGDYEERGFSVTAGLQPRSDGTGLSLKLSPQWGAPVESTPAFWREDSIGSAFGVGHRQRQQRESFRTEVSYGLLAPGSGAILKPFGQFDVLSETRRRTRLGTRYDHTTDRRELSLEVSSDIMMTTAPGAGLLDTGVDSRYEFWLKGRVLF